jgi:TonB family protein
MKAETDCTLQSILVRRVKRAIFVFLLAATAVTSNDCFAGGKAVFVYAPPPDLTKLRKYQGVKGAGVFILHIDTTGAVTSVEVQKSTGAPFLDQISIETLQKWRARPGTNPNVRVPISYTGRYPRG